MRSKNVISLLRSMDFTSSILIVAKIVLRPWAHGSHRFATMILVIRVAYLLANTRQTDIYLHRRAYKVFFSQREEHLLKVQYSVWQSLHPLAEITYYSKRAELQRIVIAHCFPFN
jgi:hypothetical protein